MDSFYIINESIICIRNLSWYDGKIYVENGEVVEGETTDSEYVSTTNNLINKKIQQNDLTLKYDYLRKLKKK